jgi:predicted methyltransferase
MRTLYPTKGAPTTLVSGILMHRIRDVDPWADTKIKIVALGSLRNAKVLDTATGLGYSAIQASQQANQLVTVEIDPAAIELMKKNPWSQKLFDNPKINLRIGDIRGVISEFKEGEFDIVVHDPPTMKLSGELYSEEFYTELFRVLKRNGKLFHYIGDPESEHGSMVTKGVIQRLKNVGFGKIDRVPQAFGLLAQK